MKKIKIKYILLGIIIFGVGVGFGKINFKNLFDNSSTQADLLAETRSNVASLNKYLTNENIDNDSQIDLDNVSFAKEGEISGHNYIQYVGLTNDENSYVSWVFDSNTKKILAIFVSENHLKDSEKKTGPAIIKALMNMYEKDITSNTKEKITEMIKTTEDNYIKKNNFIYYQKFNANELDDKYDYSVIYEMDFFIYEGGE